MTGCWAWQDEGGLPHCCHVVLPGLPAGGNVAVCVRGAHGVRMTNIGLGDWQAARRLVRAINDSLGIIGGAKVVATLPLPGAPYTSWSLRLRTSARTSTRLAPMANGSTPRIWNGGSGIRCLNSIRQRPESLRFEP